MKYGVLCWDGLSLKNVRRVRPLYETADDAYDEAVRRWSNPRNRLVLVVAVPDARERRDLLAALGGDVDPYTLPRKLTGNLERLGERVGWAEPG